MPRSWFQRQNANGAGQFRNTRASSDWGVLATLLAVGTTVALLRLTYTQAEDMGSFLSESGLIAHGASLYSGVFEIKDPYFLLTSAGAFFVLGPVGPFILDACLVALCAPTAYAAGIAAGYSRLVSIIGSVAFLLTTSGAYYGSFRSGQFAILLIAVATLLCFRNRWTLAGMAIAVVFGFKAPYLLMCIPLFALAIYRPSPLRQFAKCLGGFLIGIGGMIAILAVRGEVRPYFLMMVENFSYRSSYLSIVGRTAGTAGHIETIDMAGSSFFGLVCVLALVVSLGFLSRSAAGKARLTFNSALASMTLLFLILSAMWPHHLQALAMFSWPLTLIAATAVQRAHIEDSGTFRLQRVTMVLGVTSIAVIFALCGASFPTRSQMPLATLIHPVFSPPPEVAALEAVHAAHPKSKTFARLGMNDDLGLGAFIGADWQLSCPRFAQGGQESSITAKSTVNCIAKKPNYILISPSFTAGDRPVGSFNPFKKSVLRVIQENFSCSELGLRQDAYICYRN